MIIIIFRLTNKSCQIIHPSTQNRIKIIILRIELIISVNLILLFITNEKNLIKLFSNVLFFPKKIKIISRERKRERETKI
jgi:hypothetical protein